MAHVERFAPSPTGFLHLGHAFSALTAWDKTQAAGGQFLLRLEDIDTARSRQEYIDAIYEDLTWLGMSWAKPVMLQSLRLPAYQTALRQLDKLGVIYRCNCTRRDIAHALSAPQEGAHVGPDGPVYPGTCKNRAIADGDTAIRLDMAAAINLLGPDTIGFEELGVGPNGETGRITATTERLISGIGDIVLARKDIGTSYHLSVVVDDAAQKITHVTRGQDLFEATPIHRVLQKLLDFPEPRYFHHPLIRDENGKRLAKRDDARAIRKYRADGALPQDIREMVGLNHR